MQFFAYHNHSLVFIEEANRGIDYYCPECSGLMRLKRGPHRRKHFFHLRSHPYCRQSNKSYCHLVIQKKIWAKFPKGEAQMEKQFPSISRIADIAYFPKKIVFEIQCSPISLEEVKARNADYRKIGFTVIWLLHSRRFNQKKLSAAEAFLRMQSSYFTNIDEEGAGFFYDQWEKIEGNRRLFHLSPLIIDIKKSCQTSKIRTPLFPLPDLVKKKIKNSCYYFQGDVIDLTLKNPTHFPVTSLPQVPFSFLKKIKKKNSLRLFFLYLLKKHAL